MEPAQAAQTKPSFSTIKDVWADAHATIRRADATHGDTLDAWKKMGSPQYPTQAQIATLRKAAEVGPPQVESCTAAGLRLPCRPWAWR